MNEWEFYVGQRVVCVDPFNIEYVPEKLKIGQVYTVKKSRDRSIVVEGIDIEFQKYRFISLPEYRIMKMKEIYE